MKVKVYFDGNGDPQKKELTHKEWKHLCEVLWDGQRGAPIPRDAVHTLLAIVETVEPVKTVEPVETVEPAPAENVAIA